MPPKRSKRTYQNDIKINAIAKKYSDLDLQHKPESEVDETTETDIKINAIDKKYKIPKIRKPKPESEVDETDLDTSAFNSSIHSEASDNENEVMETNIPSTNLEDKMKFKICHNNKAVIGLEHESKFYFKGKILIKVIRRICRLERYEKVI